MIEYIRILRQLKKYLKKEEIINTNSIISAYFLYQVLNKKISEINEIDHLDIVKDFYSKHPTGKIKLNTVCNEKYILLRFFFDFLNFDKHRKIEIREIVKTKNGIYEDEKNKDFIKKYYNELIQLFIEKEKAYNDYKINNNFNYQSFYDELFELIYIYNDSGIIEFLFRLKIDKNNRNSLSHDRILYLNLERFIEKNKIELLKRYAVNVSDLSTTTKLIIEESLLPSKKKIKTIE